MTANVSIQTPPGAVMIGVQTICPPGRINVPLAVSLAVSPDDLDAGRVQLTPTCPHRLDGGPGCVTCGMTRAFASASRGRLADAWRFNRAAVPLFAGTVALFALSLTTTAFAAHGLRRRRVRTGGTER